MRTLHTAEGSDPGRVPRALPHRVQTLSQVAHTRNAHNAHTNKCKPLTIINGHTCTHRHLYIHSHSNNRLTHLDSKSPWYYSTLNDREKCRYPFVLPRCPASCTMRLPGVCLHDLHVHWRSNRSGLATPPRQEAFLIEQHWVLLQHTGFPCYYIVFLDNPRLQPIKTHAHVSVEVFMGDIVSVMVCDPF